MKILRIGAMAIVFSIAVYSPFFISFFSTWRHLEQLVIHGRITSGIIIAKEPDNHESVRYEYSVDGIKHVGTSPAAMNGLPSFISIRVGDPITVTYSTERPSESFAGYRPDAYATMSLFLFRLLPGLCLILGIVIAIGVHYGRTFLWRDAISWIRSGRPAGDQVT